ncbi:hypothetical protein [Streptomyces sp. MMBL 11-1]|uniref:hypothetical protein n=1 Tax=Streptomyces sp. MMBL 11-1 TaxID=3026420 RepID=UPI00235E211C|nr:hypothetical protein [Streptomyces sp. MMBL 11-1]
MVDKQPGDDMRLLAIAYMEFWARGDKASMRLLERDRRQIAQAVGAFAWFLMDTVVIPVQHGVGWADGWVEVDFRRRTDPEFTASLLRRRRYRRLAQGRVLRARPHLRKATREVAGMLCLAYSVEAAHDCEVSAREAILHALGRVRNRFCHTGDGNKNP